MLGRIKRDIGLLPTIESRTYLPSPRGRRIDVARTAREARRTAGETLRLFRKARPDKPRRLLLLVDVSGSMKAHSEATLRFAQTARARPPQGRDLLLRHAAVAGDPHIEAPPAGRGAGPALRTWSSTSTAAPASAPRWKPSCRCRAMPHWCAARSRWCFPTGSSAASPTPWSMPSTRLSRLSHRLIWVTPLAADPRYRPQTRAMAGNPARARRARRRQRPAGTGAIAARAAGRRERLARGQARRSFAEPPRKTLMPIVDAHHHIWRQADLPWLQGPMVPRIFGPYEPIRRDYPIEEFLADIAGSGVEKSVYVQTNWAKTGAVKRSRMGAERRRPARLAACRRRLCRPARRQCRRRAEAAGALSADARHPHAAALARQRDVPLRARRPT